MEKIDIKTSAPMRALAAAKVKYPDFFKAVDRIYKDPDAKMGQVNLLLPGRPWRDLCHRPCRP